MVVCSSVNFIQSQKSTEQFLMKFRMIVVFTIEQHIEFFYPTGQKERQYFSKSLVL